MPIHYTLDPIRKLVTTVVEGEITVEEVLQHLAKVGSDPGRGEGWGSLVDNRGAENTIDVEGQRRILAAMQSAKGRASSGRVALLTAHDVQYGMGRVFAALLDAHAIPAEIQMRVFRDEEEARAWALGEVEDGGEELSAGATG
jgi:hypothetical protein